MIITKFYTTQIMTEVTINTDTNEVNSRVKSQFTKETYAPKKPKVQPKPKKGITQLTTQTIRTMDL